MNIKSSIFPEEKESFPWDEKALQAFKNLIIDQGIKCCMEDIFLLGFLRARKFDLKRSLQLLKNYYEVRVQYPQYFKSLLPSKLEHAINANIMQILPQPDQKGRYMLTKRNSKWDTSVVNVTDMFRVMMLYFDLQITLHRSQVNRVVFIMNAEGMSLSHFLQVTPRFVHSLATIMFKDSYQVRYEELHFVNLNVITKALLSILVPLLSSKLKERIHFHSDMSTLHKFLNPEYLPEEYGGTLQSLDMTETGKMIKANEDFFRKNEEYLKMYEEERNKSFTQGKFRFVGEDEDEKVKKFIEKSEENFRCYSEDPEAFLAAMQKNTEFEITRF